MFVDQLRLAVPPQQYAEIIEPGHDTLQFDAINEKDCDRCLIFADIVEKSVLEIFGAVW